MPPHGVARPLRAALASTSDGTERFLWGRTERVSLRKLLRCTTLSGGAAALAGRSVLLATGSQLATAAALIELDGVARRLVLCTPDLAAAHIDGVVARCEVDAIACDADTGLAPAVSCRVGCDIKAPRPAETIGTSRCTTEWILLTGGTTGAPKMVVHTLDTLTAPLAGLRTCADETVWGTFYDIRRYGGLQILLRAIVGGASLVLSDADEPVSAYLTRLAVARATHLSGTPSHWRRVLMSPHAGALAPACIRLSGEIVDQSILDALSSAYPRARITHAFASTEAGVAFEVDDGLEGFPANIVGDSGPVDIRVVDGSLRLRSNRCARRYLGARERLTDAEGFVDTGDIVERRGDRYHFLGRRSGVINVGGLKVYPEEVEAAINRHPAVRMSMVRPQKNSMIGALVAADVVLSTAPAIQTNADELKRQIVQMCREELPRHKVPSTIRFVNAVEIAAAGKVPRR